MLETGEIILMLFMGLIAPLWLSLGFLAGRKTAAPSTEALTATQSDIEDYRPNLLNELRNYLEAGQVVSLKSQGMRDFANSHEAELPPAAQALVSDLSFAAARLSEQLNRLKVLEQHLDGPGAFQWPAQDLIRLAPPAATQIEQLRNEQARNTDERTSTTVTCQASLSEDEVRKLASLSPAPIVNENRRFPYDRWQHVIEWGFGERPPHDSRITLVRCHELSTTGVSFFWSDDPDFCQFLISLGSGDSIKFVAAKVTKVKAVYMHRQHQFLVSAEFTSRADHFTEELKRRCAEIQELAEAGLA